MLDDWEHWSITFIDGVPSVCLIHLLLRNVTVCSVHGVKYAVVGKDGIMEWKSQAGHESHYGKS